jgi:Cupin domain
MMKRCGVTILGLVVVAGSGGISSAQVKEAALSPDTVTWHSCGVPEFPGCDYALLHGDPVKGASDIYVRIPAGGAFPKHWHTNSHYFVGVRGTLVFNFKDGSLMTLSPGSFGFWPGREIMEGRCSNEGPCIYYDHQSDFADTHVAMHEAGASSHPGTAMGAVATDSK